MNSTLSKFADEVRLGEMARPPEGCAAILWDLDWLADCVEKTL